MPIAPAVRQEMETRAERALRRGELAEAVGLLEELAREFPSDAALAARIAQLRESADPRELTGRGPRTPEPAHHHDPRGASPEQEGERLFSLGDFGGAAAAYRRALKEKPDSELIRERLFELFRLAQSAPRHSPTDSALPAGREALLRALLDRISARKRVGLG